MDGDNILPLSGSVLDIVGEFRSLDQRMNGKEDKKEAYGYMKIPTQRLIHVWSAFRIPQLKGNLIMQVDNRLGLLRYHVTEV